MKLVVGLGNPDACYRDTYHNMGFIAADLLASRFVMPDFRLDKKSNAFLSEATLFGNKTVVCKPNTYMNLSGDAVSYLARYYKIAPRDIIIVYDDIDIKKGTVRARESGSAGTHNGMRDIVAKLNSVDFARVRVGTGLKPEYMALVDYVLAHIRKDEAELLNKAISAACDFVEDWLCGKQWQDRTVTVV